MSPTQQWTRVTAIIEAAGLRTQSIRDAHSAALEKLDAADYALARLIEDLADIMPMPNPNREAIGAVVVMPSGRTSFEELRRLDRAAAAASLASSAA